MNPIVILGLTKSHAVIHTLKILKKYKLVGTDGSCTRFISYFYLYFRHM